jgi:hypothetical protein
VLADNAAAEVANDDVQRHVVVRVADEVVVDAIDRAFLEGVLRERATRREKT